MEFEDKMFWRGAMAACVVAAFPGGLSAQAEDVIFQESFQDIPQGEVPEETKAPGGWERVDAGRYGGSGVDGAFEVVVDEENAFGYGADNSFLRISGGQAVELYGTLSSEAEVVTYSFDYIGRDQGNNSRWINMHLIGAWEGAAHIHSLRTANSLRQIRTDPATVGDDVVYGENQVLLRFDVVMNNSFSPITYPTPDGGSASLAAGMASVWINGVQVIDEHRFSGSGFNVGPIDTLRLQMDGSAVVSADLDNITVFEGAHVLADIHQDDSNATPLFQDRFHQAIEQGTPLPEGRGVWSEVTEGRSIPDLRPVEVVVDTENRFGYGTDYKVLRLQDAQNFALVARPTELEEVVTYSFEIFPADVENNARWILFDMLAGDGSKFGNPQRAHITSLRMELNETNEAYNQWRVRGSGDPVFGGPFQLYQMDTILNNSETESLEYVDHLGNTHSLEPGRASIWVDGVQVHESWNFARASIDGVPQNFGPIQAVTIAGDSAARVTMDIANVTLLRGAHVLPQIGPDRSVAGGYENWQTDHFNEAERADPSISGPDADADGDGIPNLVEYALGLDPRRPSIEGLPVTGLDSFSVGGETDEYLTLSFTAPDSVDDVGYEVQVSGELTSWTGDAVLEESISNGDGTTTYVYRDSVPLGAGERRFMRLSVNRN